MEIVWARHAWEDYVSWQESEPAMAVKINELIREIRRRPFAGIGKPEPLRGDLSGWWSRRISGEHRLVYRMAGKRGVDQRVEIAQCRYHY